MRVVTGRRHLGIVKTPSSVAGELHGVWDGDDDKTTVCAMPFDDDVVSSSDESTPPGVISGIAGGRSTQPFDEGSLDDRLPRFAVGTGDRTFERAPSHWTDGVAPTPAPHPGAPPPEALVYPQTGPFAYPVAGPYPSSPYAQVPAPPYGVPVAYGPMPYGATGPYVPVPAGTPVLRWILVGAALTFTAVFGVAAGKLLFGGSGRAGAAPAPQPAVSAPAPSAPAASAPVASAPAAPTAAVAAPPAPTAEPAPAAEPATSSSLTLDVASLSNPGEDAVPSPMAGTVTRTFLQTPRRVHKNEKLFEITRKLAPGGNSKELASKVKELEQLADKDPVYKPFLIKARREYQAAQPRRETVVVKATRNGTLQPTVGKGDRVDAQQALAMTVDTRSWIARAALVGSEQPDARWTCTVVVDAGNGQAEQRAPCTIDDVAEAEVSVVIDARKAPWLRPDGQRRQLVLEPPAAR